MKEKIILSTVLLSLSLGAFAADRPQARLAEGDNCITEPTPTPPFVVDPTPPPTINPPRPTPTPTSTYNPPTPTPTPTPSEEPCEFYKVDVNLDYSDIDYSSRGKELSIDNVVKRDTASQNLSCLSNKINDALSYCNDDFLKKVGVIIAEYAPYEIQANNARYDDCIAAYIMKEYFDIKNVPGTYTYQDTLGYGVCNGSIAYSATASIVHTGRIDGSTVIQTKYCGDGYFYFDKNCNPIRHDLVESEQICGNTTISWAPYSSPISLIWENDYNINSNITFAAFRLDPTENNAWTTWKASDKAPLLVYDPNETNFVKDATQLFGNWTFGGKRSAALTSSSTVEASAWRDGYEALGTLDRDSNGKIDGNELNDLALWFDSNRNGISEKGEVKRAKDLGITALYYNGAVKDSLSKDLRLEIGYERVVDGHKVQGTSIDWYGASAPSKAALADYYSFVRKDAPIEEHVTETKPAAVNSAHGKFTGTWEWFIDENSKLPNGYLIFGEEAKSNKVTGYSFVERRFSKSPKNALKSMVNFFNLKGETQVRNGADIMIFELNDKNRKTKSVVTLSEDGQELRGTSYVLVAHGAEIANYTWIAKKVK